ncbi:recombinase family protein [Porphyrobacter sp. ULC335]|nr:recombinase family protein [Porphyrobacter sp. ULC335]
MAENVSMIGYTRVSKADGRQVHDLQRDALIAAGVDPKRIYQDSISGARDCRPGLNACLAVLAPGELRADAKRVLELKGKGEPS